MILEQGRCTISTLIAALERLKHTKGNIVIKCTIEDNQVSPDMHDVTTKPPKPSKWHKVEDELPAEDQIVEVRHLARWHHETWLCREEHNVTKWRELPKPPKP